MPTVIEMPAMHSAGGSDGAAVGACDDGVRNGPVRDTSSARADLCSCLSADESARGPLSRVLALQLNEDVPELVVPNIPKSGHAVLSWASSSQCPFPAVQPDGEPLEEGQPHFDSAALFSDAPLPRVLRMCIFDLSAIKVTSRKRGPFLNRQFVGAL